MALIAYEEAITRTLHGVSMLAAERVGLDDAAGRVLAEDVLSAKPMPAFDYSAMDGYAVRAASFVGDGPWTLPVRGESRAGGAAPGLVPGTACRIFTGAPLPADANAVIIQENVTREEARLTTSEKPVEGQNVRPAGADLKAGVVALSRGQRLTPGRLGMVAALDRAHVAVARRPVVTIVSTGDELRSPGVAGADSSIPESNSFVIAAIARRIGALARVMPALADDAERTEQEIRRALHGSDLVVTIGGASVGDHDLVRPAMAKVGVAIDFWGVAIKPGKPVASGRFPGSSCRVLCLPGNPASASVTFALFGVALLKAMLGEPRPRPRRIPMRVIGSHRRKPGREEFLRARLEMHDRELCAVLPAGQASGAVTSMAGADVLVILPADVSKIVNGDNRDVIMLSDIWSP